MDKVVELVGGGHRQQSARDYAAALEDALDRGRLRRAPHWTEAIAVGGKEYVTSIEAQIRGRIRTKTSEVAAGAREVREPAAPYGLDSEVDEGVPYSQNLGMRIEHISTAGNVRR
jgi:hypothetical protein